MSLSKVAVEIFLDAMDASLPKKFIAKQCLLQGDILEIQGDRYDLSNYNNIYLLGSGKAAVTMAYEIERLLEDKITKGLVVDVKSDADLRFISVEEGSHPVVSQRSLDATQKLVTLMQQCDKDDLYIYLLSGGSSALLELPIKPICLEDLQKATQLMLHSGLDIQSMNVVRKHLSQIKGGRLGQMNEATGIVLVLSDIIGDDLYAIGSAPLFADSSSFEDAKNILLDKEIYEAMPQSVKEVLEAGIEGMIDETPKAPKKRIKHYIMASNQLALQAAKKSATKQGLSTLVVSKPMSGDVAAMVNEMREVIQSSNEDCVIFGGECTVEVKGEGQGGRNQHAVALMLQSMCQEGTDICFLSAGTDGIDGNSDAAGAVTELSDCTKIAASELKTYIENFDSYKLFKKLDRLVVTGPSGTNVIDIAIIIQRR